ncbi:hypothetical protein EXIGLDRAFT_667056 [Exidia glandulosa HHB12029]|uniref:Kinetochore protein SPC25 n=1 Tax=Exidia glandulosa HHB12029 TaxID=1314781 RepID=A0A166BFU0_EXIGL|nr:hypothetical protein EXIGLDRAFT_667056 [Exidia glandulosa HHB12029]
MSLKYQPVNLAELLKHPHPSVDLRLDQYSRLTEAFTKSVRAYVARATSEIHARRDTHVKEIKIAGEKAKETEIAIARMKEQGMELMKVVAKEEAERKRVEGELNELKRALASSKAKCGALQTEIEQKRAHIDMLRADKNADRELLDRRADECVPELVQLQRKLRLGIEGINANLLQFRFPHMRDPAVECSIVLDHSSRTYKVAKCDPPLTNIGQLLDDLNESRQLYVFLIRVFESFQHV